MVVSLNTSYIIDNYTNVILILIYPNVHTNLTMCHKPWIVCLIYKHTHSAHLYRCTLHLINLIKLYVLYILLHPPSYYCHIDTNTLSMYIVRMLVVRYNTQLITRYAHHVCQTCRGGQTSVAGVWSSNTILIYCNV